MFDRLRTALLRFLKVPPEPAPPFGAPGSLRVFRAGRNFYKLRLLRWGFGQIGALAGIIFSLWFVHQVQLATERLQRRVAPVSDAASVSVAPTNSPAVTENSTGETRRKGKPRRSQQEQFEQLVAKWPKWIFPLVLLFELAGLGFYFFQLCFTYAAVRLDFDLRWYVVTDRSLRIRSGLWSVQEMTMSFANLQQVMVSQGPLQRFLGIADLRVESAGGGGATHGAKQGQLDSLHTGVFHGVENATEVRDLILARLRSFRETGLGDPDEVVSSAPTTSHQSEVLVAARNLLAEARALRAGWLSRE